MTDGILSVSLQDCESFLSPEINNASWYPQGPENVLSPNRCLIKIAKRGKNPFKATYFPACAVQYSSSSYQAQNYLKLNKT